MWLILIGTSKMYNIFPISNIIGKLSWNLYNLSECVLGWGKTILIYASYMQYSKMCTFRKKTKFGSKCSQKSFSAWRVCMTKTRVSDEKMLFFPTLRYSHTLLSWTDVMSLENRRSKVLCGCDIHPSSFYYETNYGNGGIISTMWEKVY